MPRPCEVKGCEASWLSRRVMHRVPSQGPYRTLWRQAIGRTEESLSKTASICSDHFEPSSYRGVRLRFDAVPTLFLTEAAATRRAAELSSQRAAAATTSKLRPLAAKPTLVRVLGKQLVPIKVVPSVSIGVVPGVPMKLLVPTPIQAALLVLPVVPENRDRLHERPFPRVTIKSPFEMTKKIGWKPNTMSSRECNHIPSSATDHPEEAQGAVTPVWTTTVSHIRCSTSETNMAVKDTECPANKINCTGQECSKDDSSLELLPVSSKHRKGRQTKTHKRAKFVDDLASNSSHDDNTSEDDFSSPASKWVTKNDCFLARCLGKPKVCKSDYDWIQKQFAEIQEETSKLKNSASIRDPRSVQ